MTKRRRSTYLAPERGDASPFTIVTFFMIALLVAIIVAGVFVTMLIGGVR